MGQQLKLTYWLGSLTMDTIVAEKTCRSLMHLLKDKSEDVIIQIFEIPKDKMFLVAEIESLILKTLTNV